MDLNASQNKLFAEQINSQMRTAVMPVTVFVGIEVVFGFFGNLVVLYVFLFRYHTCNFRYFVLCLALTDIASTLTTMPGEIVTQLYWYVYPFPTVCKIKSFFNVFTVSSEALCLLTIAVDRYRKVCHPFGRQIRPNHARWLCVLILCSSFVIAFPVAIFWGTHDEKYVYKGMNITVTVCEKDQKYVDTQDPLRYSLSIEVTLSISLALMFLLYVLIARTLLMKNLGNDINETSDQRNKTNQQEESTSENAETCKTLKNVNATSENRASGTSVTSDSDIRSKKKELRDRNSSNPGTVSTLGRQSINAKVRRKTLIMFILTVTFIVTTSMYLALLSLIAHGVLPKLSDQQRAAYFFFFRFYFINHVINPFVYGVLDPRFRKAMITFKNMLKCSHASSTNL